MSKKEKQELQSKQSALKKVIRILQPKERKRLAIVMLLSLAAAAIQSVGIASFMPFMNMLTDLQSIHSNRYLSFAYQYFNFQSELNFAAVSGIIVALLVLISNTAAIMTSWLKNRFILLTSHQTSKRLLEIYLNKPYQFYLRRNTSELTKVILSDSQDFTFSYLNGIIEMFIYSIMVAAILLLLLWVNIKVTLIIMVIFAGLYGVLALITKPRLRKNGSKIIDANKDKFKYVSEALGSFKISKTMGIESFFLERYSKASKRFAKLRLLFRTLSEVPKNIMDTIVFCGLALVIVYLIIKGIDLDSIIPVLSVYVIAGYRMMPELARIFSALSNIVHHRPILDKIYAEVVLEAEPTKRKYQSDAKKTSGVISFDKIFKIDDVHFNYEQTEGIINGISLDIIKGSVVGFAGTTGAGKTTLVDIILGLLPPSSGQILIDEQKLDDDNIANWRKLVGYVPQDIFLTDDTIMANIAFGIPSDEIDMDQIKQSAQIAAISDFIETELPDQYQTLIGERGVRLSGGQRQRLGLARALYRNPKVLVLDEATSALDGATEESVIRSIHNISTVETIVIIAHRLNTLKGCDKIYLLDHGKIVDQGSYSYLIQNNAQFQKMAKIETRE